MRAFIELREAAGPLSGPCPAVTIDRFAVNQLDGGAVYTGFAGFNAVAVGFDLSAFIEGRLRGFFDFSEKLSIIGRQTAQITAFVDGFFADADGFTADGVGCEAFGFFFEPAGSRFSQCIQCLAAVFAFSSTAVGCGPGTA